MRTNQLNPPSRQSSAQWIGISGLVVDQPRRIFPRPSPTWTRHSDPVQGRFNQPDFGRGRRVQVVSQRKTLAVCHHHPLRTLSTFGFAHAGPPFLAGAKLPSANVSAQSSWPCSSSWPNRARHAFSQISCSSQARSRRQQVLGEGYPAGRSFHRAPLRNTHKIPSNTGRQWVWDRRWAMLSVRNNGAICAHWAIQTYGETLLRTRENEPKQKRKNTNPHKL